jgi:hypothetical protein
MDLSKFLDLLLKEELFFCRASEFKDKFEGVIPKQLYQREKQRLEELYRNDENKEKYISNELRRLESLPKKFYVYCWHLSEHQSEAMWRLYSQSNDVIAIKTKFGLMREALPSFVSAAPVHYGNHKIVDLGARNFQEENLSILIKWLSFEHEKELRFFFTNFDMSGLIAEERFLIRRYEKGFGVKVNLVSIIEQVYVSPYASDWFAMMLEEAVKRLGYSFEVILSDLLKPPSYLAC